MVAILHDPTAATKTAGRPLPAFPGWSIAPAGEPRLEEVRHESGRYPVIYVRSVGWLRPQVIVGGSEKRFGTIGAAVAWVVAN